MHAAPPSTATASLRDRASGILLHPTSLPGPHGCGDLGASAHAFVEWLAGAKQHLWQMLPIGPIGYGNSPYSALSSFAGNPLLIGLDALAAEGLLPADARRPRLSMERVNYAATSKYRLARLQEAFRRWSEGTRERASFEAFREGQADWLDDYCLYKSIKEEQGQRPWVEWPAPLRCRDPSALAQARQDHRGAIEWHAFVQWIFDTQWKRLREHAALRGIALVGDLPIFVAHDSADVWAHQELFHLDASGALEVVAGVPPDYFSRTGQRWGNPLYRWGSQREALFRFWIRRFEKTLEQFDLLRLDHFIGFVRYWEIPAGEETAIHGVWREGPGVALFDALRRVLGLQQLPLIAEDLGAVTPEVIALRDRLGLPGTKVLQFAFGDDPQAPSFLPHNYPRLSVVYTGTHDNDTVAGWYRDPGGEASVRSSSQIAAERAHALRYLDPSNQPFHWKMIRAAMASVARFAIFPLQDVLGLGSSARMNRPGTTNGNWEWRVRTLPPDAGKRLAALTETFGRMETTG